MESTTNISELPIKTSLPNKSQDEMSNQVDIRESKITMDPGIHSETSQKNVRFSDQEPSKDPEISPSGSSSNSMGIANETKLILLASVIFFIFIDTKFKKYIVNILTQIFGSFLKTETGGTSKIGNVFYAMTFGLVLYVFTRFVDITSLQLAL